VRFLMPSGGPRSEGETAERLARMRTDWDERGFGRWAVEELQTGRFVGHAGLGLHRLWPTDPELGWGVDPELWGRGYATEAAASALRHAFAELRLPRVVSLLHPANAASIRVAEKLGEESLSTVRWPETELDLLVYVVRRPD
jgi:RimJ/RimL family protein N-acetyltransferase